MLGFNTPIATAPRLSLRRMRVMGMALVLAAAAIASTAGPVLGWDAGAFSSADESLLFSLTNQDRASAGLNVLVNDSYLHTEARVARQGHGGSQLLLSPDTALQQHGLCRHAGGRLLLQGGGREHRPLHLGRQRGHEPDRSRVHGFHLASQQHPGIVDANGRRRVQGGGWPEALHGALLGPVRRDRPDADADADSHADPAGRQRPRRPRRPATPPRRPLLAPRRRRSPLPKPVTTKAPSTVATLRVTPTPSHAGAHADRRRICDAHRRAATPAPAATTAPTAMPSGSPATSTAPQPATITSLRVREKPASQSPLDSLFRSLFGGLLGW